MTPEEQYNQLLQADQNFEIALEKQYGLNHIMQRYLSGVESKKQYNPETYTTYKNFLKICKNSTVNL